MWYTSIWNYYPHDWINTIQIQIWFSALYLWGDHAILWGPGNPSPTPPLLSFEISGHISSSELSHSEPSPWAHFKVINLFIYIVLFSFSHGKMLAIIGERKNKGLGLDFAKQYIRGIILKTQCENVPWTLIIVSK